MKATIKFKALLRLSFQELLHIHSKLFLRHPGWTPLGSGGTSVGLALMKAAKTEPVTGHHPPWQWVRKWSELTENEVWGSTSSLRV